MSGIEFNCTDCGRRTVAFFVPRISVCSVCLWVRQSVPSHEQEAVRERLGVPLIASAP